MITASSEVICIQEDIGEFWLEEEFQFISQIRLESSDESTDIRVLSLAVSTTVANEAGVSEHDTDLYMTHQDRLARIIPQSGSPDHLRFKLLLTCLLCCLR